MTRLNVAFVLPAGLLGCLTMSAALVVGHAEISQLRPDERRMNPVVETVESPFRVIAGVRVPDPAPSHTSVPSPSAATAPASAPLPDDVPIQPPADLLPPDALAPPDVDQPRSLRGTVDRQVDRTPDAAEPVVAQVVDTVFDTAFGAIDLLGLGVPLQQGWRTAEPTYDAAWEQSEPARAAAVGAWDDTSAAVREARS